MIASSVLSACISYFSWEKLFQKVLVKKTQFKKLTHGYSTVKLEVIQGSRMCLFCDHVHSVGLLVDILNKWQNNYDKFNRIFLQKCNDFMHM